LRAPVTSSPMPAVRVYSRSAPAGLHPVPPPTSSCVPRTYWPHGVPESAPRDANSATKLSLAREPAVPQRSTATPPQRPAIKPGWVPPARAQPPISLRLREVRDEEAAGSNPVTPTHGNRGSDLRKRAGQGLCHGTFCHEFAMTSRPREHITTTTTDRFQPICMV